ncbi:DivIVA domain-containing protein [Emticicia oligotrophica DSM 17448]|uniref:DivIVA domain-containing protein n=1 Tax=Emticicia oligotrophica (strain DSM 17448 / CIP 109782 / MTCC 6937 / GPTSA100-15) TaxID=929562 RepID=A0ABM5N784_EMTOG|nr:DivIVA domain-containing protein [Emticicia oligotrophica]AFK05363.1 DivIVA domain-containing protein [Emticicia oligotrophica DSM 17448]
MKITPLEIRQHEFEKTFRGYNIEEVDSFLMNISQEWERVLNESKMLRMQLEIAEKEANKLREIEMTLFKTLKTAEDTSTMITEQANQQADKYLQDAKLQGEKLLLDAQNKANEIIRQAESKAKYIKEDVLGEVRILERDFKAMDQYKTNLLVQMRTLSNATLEHVQRFEDKFDKEGVEEKFKEATTLLTGESIEAAHIVDEKHEVKANSTILFEDILSEEEVVSDEIETLDSQDLEKEVIAEEDIVEHSSTELEEEEDIENLEMENSVGEFEEENKSNEEELVAEIPNIEEESSVEEMEVLVEEPEITTTIIASSANRMSAEEFEENLSRKAAAPKEDELEIIEGIGPKIAMLLLDAGIFTFRDLATTPVYKIQEILDKAGPQFAMHDPSTWTQQAKLAAEGRWEDLEALKFYLMGGRKPKEEDIEEEVDETPLAKVEDVEPETKAADIDESLKSVIQSINAASNNKISENNLDSITEDMLEKVNKVKAAIRKAMVEKGDAQTKDTSPLPTVNDIIGKGEGGSFFDNI